MLSRSARFRPGGWRPRGGLWLSASVALLSLSNHALPGEGIPERLRPGLVEAGRICLAAKHERDVAPAVASIRSAKRELLQTNGSLANASRLDSALEFLRKWQTYLACRNDERWGKAGAMIMHLSNLPIAHLILPRSEIRDRLTKMPREELGAPAAPLDVHRWRDENDESGTEVFDLIWKNVADDAEYCVIERDEKNGPFREVAILPPDSNRYYPTARDANPSSPEAQAVQRAARSCLDATKVEDLDPVLKDLASFWRGDRPGLSRSERAEQSRLDCALLFVALWQDSLAELREGNKTRAAKILRRLAGANRDYPILQPRLILERAAAVDPNVGDFVADSEP